MCIPVPFFVVCGNVILVKFACILKVLSCPWLHVTHVISLGKATPVLFCGCVPIVLKLKSLQIK